MQVHFSIYLLFSPQEFDWFSAWLLEWIEDFGLIHQIWKWSLNWWECLTVNWTFLLWTFIVSKCKNTAPRNVDKEKRIHDMFLYHKYFHPLESSRHLNNRGIILVSLSDIARNTALLTQTDFPKHTILLPNCYPRLCGTDVRNSSLKYWSAWVTHTLVNSAL